MIVRNAPEGLGRAAESVKSKSKASGELCKNCNPYERIFQQLVDDGLARAQ
jgi:hypothetical protein